jgi:GT2 family glycosyltransferase
MNSPRVHIILLNWNGWKDTIECLESVLRLDYPNYTVVVCDNASTDGSCEKIGDWAEGRLVASCDNPQLASLSSPPITKPILFRLLTHAEAEQDAKPTDRALPLTLIQTGQNAGFASGCNVGMRYALNSGCDFVWLLNNDTVVEPDALQQLITTCKTQGEKSICGSTVFYYHSPNVVQVLGGVRYNSRTGVSTPIGENRVLSKNDLAHASPVKETETQLDCLIGASIFAPRSFLLEVGLMDEQYFLYSEENDWAERGRRKGFKILYAPQSVIYHKLGSSTKSTNASRHRSFLSDYHQTRSRIIFTKKFYPSNLRWIRLTLMVGGLKRLLWGKPKHALMQWKMMVEP